MSISSYLLYIMAVPCFVSGPQCAACEALYMVSPDLTSQPIIQYKGRSLRNAVTSAQTAAHLLLCTESTEVRCCVLMTTGRTTDVWCNPGLDCPCLCAFRGRQTANTLESNRRCERAETECEDSLEREQQVRLPSTGRFEDRFSHCQATFDRVCIGPAHTAQV